jgi:hypothetical protein
LQNNFVPDGMSNNVDGRCTSNLRVRRYSQSSRDESAEEERGGRQVGAASVTQDVINIPVYVHIIQNTEGKFKVSVSASNPRTNQETERRVSFP